MSEVNIVAFLYPVPGKEDKLKSLLKDMCKNVHDKEDYTYRYMMTEALNAETPDIIMIETYKDEASADEHVKTEHFNNLIGVATKEGLFAKEPYLVKTRTKAGFDLDRKLVS